MPKKVLLVAVPAPSVKQHPIEKEYWNEHYTWKVRKTFPNLGEEDLLSLGNTENQNVGPLQLVGHCRNNRIDVIYMAPSLRFKGDDRNRDFFDDVLHRIEEYMPDYVGLSAHTCATPESIEYSKAIKETHPSIVTILGGPHATGLTRSGKGAPKSTHIALDEVLREFDYVVSGAGEIPLMNIINGNPNTDGVSFRNDDGTLTINPISRQIIRVGEKIILNPANDAMGIPSLPGARVFAGLGCKGDCVFCADWFTGRGGYYTNRPLQDTFDEILWLYSNLGSKHIYFGDEDFLFDKDKVREISNWAKEIDLDLTFSCQTRLYFVNPDVVKMLGDSGKFTEIQIGVESGSESVSKTMKKKSTKDMVRSRMDIIRKAGMQPHGYFLIGLPGETYETAEETISLMSELVRNHDAVVEYRAVIPFPGTDMWDLPEKYGLRIKHTDWSRYRGEFAPPHDLQSLSSEEIHQLYIEGLSRVTKLYRERNNKEFGNYRPNVGVISAVTEGGF